MAARIAVLFAALLSVLPAAMPAAAQTIDVLSAGAARAAVDPALALLQRDGGTAANAAFMPVRPLLKRLSDGARPDIVVLSAEAMAEAAAGNHIVAASVAEVGRVGIGVAVREGAPLPDIATPEAFKRTLLAVHSITYIDPARGTSGAYFAALIDRLGIAAEIKAKAILGQSGYVAEAVAKGEAELAVHQITEILPVKGVIFVGPLPASLQKITIYQAALGAHAANPAAARAFLAILRTPELRAIAKAKGYKEAP